MSSQRMAQLLSELTERSDVVIINSPPLLTVSHPLPLTKLVSGVVLLFPLIEKTIPEPVLQTLGDRLRGLTT